MLNLLQFLSISNNVALVYNIKFFKFGYTMSFKLLVVFASKSFIEVQLCTINANFAMTQEKTKALQHTLYEMGSKPYWTVTF